MKLRRWLALVSSAAARRRFPQARPGSPAKRLRHSTSAGSGYTQLPVIRKGNVRKLASGSDPAGVEPPAAQSGARSPHSKVAPSMRRGCETQLADRDSEFPTHSLRRRSLRLGLRRSLRRGLSRKQLSASLCRELRREFCRIDTNGKVCLTALQNSLDTDSIARKPAPEAKFQVSRTAGCTALAGPNRDETTDRGLRGLRRLAATAPRDWRPPNPSPMNPVPGGTQSFASAAENRQVPTHFPGTSIARPLQRLSSD